MFANTPSIFDILHTLLQRRHNINNLRDVYSFFLERTDNCSQEVILRASCPLFWSQSLLFSVQADKTQIYSKKLPMCINASATCL